MADGVKDEQPMPDAKQQTGKKPYSRPVLRRLGSVLELTGAGASPTMIDGLMMRAM
jgi:hypothetical protein